MTTSRWWTSDTVAVVTGANKGMGFATVRGLASRGLTVILAARDERRGTIATEKLHTELGLKNVVFRRLDVADPESAAEFAEWIRHTYGGLDILVNNAGVFLPENDPERASQVIAVNYSGTKRVTEALLPLLRPSAAGARIIIVTGSFGQLSYFRSEALREELRDPNRYTEETLDNFAKKYLAAAEAGTADADGYNNSVTVSKGLINCYIRALAKRVATWRPTIGEKIYVNCVDPGLVKTDLNPNGTLTPDEGADTTVWLALLPPHGYPSGSIFEERKEAHF